jgi:aminoglycoside phosphotransferase (APT) family kinase protein
MTVWLVDGEWTFRFPRRSVVIPGLENEIACLPRLAPLLPLPIPVPRLIGQPSEDYGWPFYGASFLPGKELADGGLDEEQRVGLGRPLAEFLCALHSLDLDLELPVDRVRRADMTYRVPKTREWLAELERLGLWRAPPAVSGVLDAASELGPAEATAIVHCDLHLRHLLVDGDGAPSAVIDWIDLCRADPGVDLCLYWAALPPDGRDEFLRAYGPLSEDQLLRGRVLALFLCGALAIWGYHEGVESVKREALAGLACTCS